MNRTAPFGIVSKLVAVSLGCAAIGMLMTAAAAATRVTCNPTKVTATVSDAFRYTASTTFVPLAEAGGQFVQGGSRPSCVIVRFDGYITTDPNTVISIAATIDGNPIAPDEVRLAYNETGYRARGWTFIVPNVAPGPHRIGFKFRSNTGQGVYTEFTNTIIHHAP